MFPKDCQIIPLQRKAFVRVDFYEISGKVYFGEITFFPCSGFMPLYPEKYDDVLGKLIQLPTM